MSATEEYDYATGYNYVAMFECEQCGNQRRIATFTKIGKLQTDEPGCCDESRVDLVRCSEWTVL